MATLLEEPRYTRDRRAMVRRDGGVLVLHLEGTEEEMARQHGELLAREIGEVLVPFTRGLLRSRIREGEGLLDRLSSRFVRRLLELLTTTLSSNAPSRYRRAQHALMDAAGHSRTEVDIALGSPDALLLVLVLLDGILRLRTGLLLPRTGRPLAPRTAPLGCAGAVALPETTTDGHLLHGRNMDYDGLGTVDRLPLVAFCRPASGPPFAYVSSAGIHTAALTALCSSGLCLGSNTDSTRDVSPRGVPFFVAMDAVVREATSIADAPRVLGRFRRAAGYTLVLSHGPSGTAGALEFSSRKIRMRWPERGLLAATNHYLHPEMAATIPTFAIVDHVNTEARYARLRAALEEKRGRLDVEAMVDCLRDTRDARTGRPRPLGDPVCNYLNLTSVVTDVTARRLFVSSGLAPAALGGFVSFDLDLELDGFLGPRSYPVVTIEPSRAAASVEMEGVHAFQRAHLALHRDHDAERAFAELLVAERAIPGEPKLELSLALVGFVLGRWGEAREAADRFLSTVERDDPRRYRGHLVHAWCADLEGGRGEALEHYDRALRAGRADAGARIEIEDHRRHRLTTTRASRFLVDLFNARRQPS